ncbi:MAG: metallophosphoesterase family protein [Tannerella sp.]|jgi:3',5'-cyclic AMP phosphodiesterase CpdA|nr:metallophosphoesterase family protein [Tannerella sp.]
MKFCYLFISLLILSVPVCAQNELRFDKNRKFKIVQIADIHYIADNDGCSSVLPALQRILNTETPDLVIFTGDLIYGKPAGKSISEVLQMVSDHKIPFGITFGNHDDEFGMSRQELYDLTKNIPYNLTSTTEGLTGVTNYILPVKSSVSDSSAFVIYVFDSNAYSKIENLGGYDHIHFDQIAWYRKNSLLYRKNNGGNAVPSFAFFHIPLPEYNTAASDETAILTGTRMEKACASGLNSGLFLSMKEMGDVLATFAGHDHDNDYAVNYNNIMLAYGRFSGCNTVYNNLKPLGVRVIELSEGSGSFRTWIRLNGGRIVNDIQCPDFFMKGKN